MDEIIRAITIISEAMHLPCYLFMNDENKLIFVSKAFTELTNISQDDVNSSRITNFSGVVHKGDLELLIEIKDKSEELLMNYKLKGNDLCRIIFTTNFRIRTPNNGYRYVDHQSYPVYFRDNSIPWISMNIMKPSHKRGIDRITVGFADNNVQLLYSRKQKKFVPEHKMKLKNIEVEILRLTSEGCIEKQIYDKLGVKPSHVNYYKREIFNKLNVNSMQEAIYVALLSGLITVDG